MGRLLTVVSIFVLFVAVQGKMHCKCIDVYHSSRRISSWEQARDRCLALGGDLVKIDDKLKNKNIISLLEGERMKRRQIGWYIGGKYSNGKWRWADGSRMDYTAFPQTSLGASFRVADVINYAGIFYDNGAYNWGYVSPRETNMGYICEINHC